MHQVPQGDDEQAEHQQEHTAYVDNDNGRMCPWMKHVESEKEHGREQDANQRGDLSPWALVVRPHELMHHDGCGG